jgi:hypothetical protein
MIYPKVDAHDRVFFRQMAERYSSHAMGINGALLVTIDGHGARLLDGRGE